MARALPLTASHTNHSCQTVIAAPPGRRSSRARVALLAFCLISGCTSEARETPRAAVASTPASPAAEAVIPLARTSYVPGDSTVTGTISGTVRLAAPLPALPPVPTGSDSTLCGPNMPDESVREKSGGLEGAVVWVEGVHKGRNLPTERRIELENDRCKLAPRVQAALVGGAMNIIGHDHNRQHLHFAAFGETSTRAAILLGGAEQLIPTELPLKSPGLVRVTDVDHSWPRAYIAVFDHPYFAVTRPDGSFEIDGVPQGTYTLHVWHERTRTATQPVQVVAGGTARTEIALTGK